MAFLSLPDNLLQDAYNVHCFSKKNQVAHKTCPILVWGAEPFKECVHISSYLLCYPGIFLTC